MSVAKVVRFKLNSINPRPLSFAFITARLVPSMSYGRLAVTVWPHTLETRTNEYGFAELTLYANDVLDIDESKYLITITYNNRSYLFMIRLEESMDDVLDFEELLNRESLSLLDKCRGTEEGTIKLTGSKYFF